MTKETYTEWWDDHRNLAMVADYLVDEMRADEIPLMLERPWRYVDERSAALALVNA